MTTGTEAEEAAPGPAPPGVPIVGIGASAGGLDALQKLVAGIPVDTGLAFVVVQHLPPDHDSILDQLLQAKTALPVCQAGEGDLIEENAVYVAPATHEVRIDGERLRLEPRPAGRVPYSPIDGFFASLAEARGRNAYCVVLSGTGSDGTEGVKAIKSAGGIAMVQDGSGARFPGMPNSAASTGLVDFVLSAEEIAGRLSDIARHREGVSEDDASEALQSEIEAALPAILERVSVDGGQDFASYKPGTLVRRIERRMALQRMRRVESFLSLLGSDEDEASRLAQDFLIGVTHFFRDPEAFEALRAQVILPLLQTDAPSIRVWVPGCSTGEEAYSIAMLFIEAMNERGDHRRLHVFGTDIDLAALSHARGGTYPPSQLSSLSEQRRARFFTSEQGRMKAVPALREACVFAPHNLLQDPPFSRLDLISCRNLMIYFDADAQRRLIPRFHFALQEHGALFLGPAEGLAGEDAFFDTLDQKHRLFRRDPDAPVRYSPFLDASFKGRAVAGVSGSLTRETVRGEAELGCEAVADQTFLCRFASPYALVSRRGEVRYLSEQMTRFVRPTRGVPTSDIDAYLAAELRLPVRGALAELNTGKPDHEGGAEPITVPDIVVASEGERRLFDLVVAPIDADPSLVMIVLNEVRQANPAAPAEARSQRDGRGWELLEREAVGLRRQLQVMRAEHDVSSQELRNSNEELLSINEELQSSNEELETSREELQSINEELETVNEELAQNNVQLTRANSDLKNLFESTDVAVLFLDGHLCVRSFTPATTALFGIKQRDVGRPLTDLSSRVSYPELADDAERVSRTLQLVEREVEITRTGETFVLRMRPYRTTDDLLDGLVLTFFDITERKNAQRALERKERDLRRQYAELETLYDTAPVGLSLMDRDMHWVRINKQLADINGFPPEAHVGVEQSELIPDIDQKIVDIQRRVLETGKPQLGIEVTGETPAEPDVTRHWITDYYPVAGEDGVFAVGCCIREVTAEKALLAKVEANEAQLRRTLDNSIAFVAVLGLDGTLKEVNRPAIKAGGLAYEEVIGKPFADAYWWDVGPGIQARLRDGIARAARGEMVRYETEVAVAGGERIDVDFLLAPSIGEDGEVIEVIASAFDITERKRAEAQLVTLLGELQHRVKNTLATVAAVSRFLGDGVEDVPTYLERLESRLGAISRTHDILTSTDWRGADLAAVVGAEAAPYQRAEAPRVVVEGDAMPLTATEALSLGMAVHELVTNSVKYGALSVPEGRVTVTASMDAGHGTDLPRRIAWKETGGPPVTTPTRQGFGSFMIGRVLGADLRGKARMSFEPNGVRCDIALPPG